MRSHARRRRTIWLGLGTLLLALAGQGLAQPPPGSWPTILASDGFTVPVASGILYSHFAIATSDGPLDMHHLHIDLGNPSLRLGVGLAHDRLLSEDETVSSMVLRSGAVAGINGDYFDIHESGTPLNIVIQDGHLLRSPWRFVALAIGKDGRARIVRFRWTGALVLPETGETHPLDGYNSGLSSDGIVAVSDVRGYGAPPPEPGGRQTVAELTPAGETARFLVKQDAVVDVSAPNDASRYFVKQIWPQQAFYAPFPKDEMILIGRGSGSDWLQRKIAAGVPVQVHLVTDPDWHDVQSAIGGGPLLVDEGQLVTDPDPPGPKDRDQRFPLIGVGLSRDGRTMMVVEVDGRQPGLSIGLTRSQLAAYLQDRGAYQAMTLDSGGSATVVARLPGQSVPTVVNSPSDGRERPVADALLIYTSSVPGPAVRLLVNANQPLRLFAGATAPLSIIGVDGAGNPVPPQAPVIIAPQGVSVDSDWTVHAGTEPASGALEVRSGSAAGSAPITVLTHLGRLVALPTTVNLVSGAGWRFTLAGLDPDGHQVVLPGTAGTWVVNPPWLGTISAPGEFVAGERLGTGKISVRLGGAAAEARVAVESTARLLSQFDQGGWSFQGYPETVTGSVAQVSEPRHGLHPSAKLAFQLDGATNRAAYLETQLPIPGAPTGMTLWAYGDGSGVWFRGTYTQANGLPGTVTFARRVNWTGWRSVTAELPQGLAYPITWTSFYVVETDPTHAPHGVLYLSSVRAIYPGRQ